MSKVHINVPKEYLTGANKEVNEFVKYLEGKYPNFSLVMSVSDEDSDKQYSVLIGNHISGLIENMIDLIKTYQNLSERGIEAAQS